MAGLEIVRELLVRPSADAGSLVGGDVIGVPAFNHRARELLAIVHGEGDVAGRVALAAMTERCRKIGAAIFLSGKARRVPKAMLIEESQIPECHGPALVERERETVRRRRAVHGREAEDISFNCDRVIAADPTIGGVGKRRIEMGTVFGYAAVQSTYEIVIAPSTNACLPIGCDFRRIDGSERQFERQSAGKRFSARRIVAGCTIRGASEILSTRHQLGRWNDVGCRYLRIAIE